MDVMSWEALTSSLTRIQPRGLSDPSQAPRVCAVTGYVLLNSWSGGKTESFLRYLMCTRKRAFSSRLQILGAFQHWLACACREYLKMVLLEVCAGRAAGPSHCLHQISFTWISVWQTIMSWHKSPHQFCLPLSALSLRYCSLTVNSLISSLIPFCSFKFLINYFYIISYQFLSVLIFIHAFVNPSAVC